MVNKNIYTGFYLTKNYNRELYNYCNPKSDELSLLIEDFCIDDAHIFLNGICHVFAYVLSLEYGYDIYELYDENGLYLHHFCMSKYNDIDVFIDVRGITSNEQLFSSHFKLINANNRKKVNKIEKDVDFKDYSIEFAKYIIDKNSEYYDVKKIRDLY